MYRSAAWSRLAPLNHEGLRLLIANPPGLALADRERLSEWNGVDPGWLSTLGTRLVAGRDFDTHDRAGTPIVAIVNEAFARRVFAGGTAVGQTIAFVSPPGVAARPAATIVGVVEDAAYESLRDSAQPTIYQALSQGRQPSLPFATLCVSAIDGSAAVVIRDVAHAVSGADPDLQFTLHTMEDLAGESVAVERILAMLSGFFGALALLLAAIGLYGVVSYSVNRRRAEIGIRIALGARPGGIIRMILGGIGRSVAVGIAAGMVLSLWLARFVSALLYRIEPGDPLNLVSAIVGLTAVGLLAAWLPARRAARLDPTEVLREQ